MHQLRTLRGGRRANQLLIILARGGGPLYMIPPRKDYPYLPLLDSPYCLVRIAISLCRFEIEHCVEVGLCQFYNYCTYSPLLCLL